MQALTRPVVRTAWATSRTTSFLGFAISPATQARPKAQLPRAWLRNNSLAFEPTQIRTYSAEPPKKEADTTPSKDSSQPTLNTEETASRLPSTHESQRSDIHQRFSHIMDTLQSRVLNASQTLNDVTGYSGIEAIKVENTKLEAELAAAHERLRLARAAYKTSNAKRAATQREVTTLLARKDGWSPTDLERFTELYRTDHVLEGEVVAAQEALTEAEAEEQSLGQRLNAGILKRYHEEQIWSDRIRRASTWGTWGLMGMNFLLFLVLQFVAEPWRRKRLVRGVVEEEKQVLEAVRIELEAVKGALARREEEKAAPAIVDDVPAKPQPQPLPQPQPQPWATFDVSDPSQWKLAAADLASDRPLQLTMREASILALEALVTGAALAGAAAFLLART